MEIDFLEDNKKLVQEFGAERIDKIKDLPNFYTFKKGLIYSHRDFDKFWKALKEGKKVAIVSGLNASGTLHLGHKVVFDTNLFFQKEFNVDVYIPISDDESYVAKKVETQEEALYNAINLVKQLIAYGFDPKKTHFIIDQIYTNIYNLAIKLSRKLTLSEVKATYGYSNEQNAGLHFYPAVQAAHVLLPFDLGYDAVLVPIGPDEDAHLRIARDLATRFNYNKPAVLHLTFLPGIDGNKMSKSRNNAIYLNDSMSEIKKKIWRAFSGGQPTLEEHRKLGGNPDIDIACQYLAKFYLDEKEAKELFEGYRKGTITTGDVKKKLIKYVSEELMKFQERLKHIKFEDIINSIMQNESFESKIRKLF